MVLNNLIYFEPIYCVVEKVIFILKRPSTLIIPKVYFHRGFFVLDCVLQSRKGGWGESRKGAWLSRCLWWEKPPSPSLTGTTWDPAEIWHMNAPCVWGWTAELLKIHNFCSEQLNIETASLCDSVVVQ